MSRTYHRALLARQQIARHARSLRHMQVSRQDIRAMIHHAAATWATWV